MGAEFDVVEVMATLKCYLYCRSWSLIVPVALVLKQA